jgi:alkylation response protein AidB-like acyl-CoA dehydrogenase
VTSPLSDTHDELRAVARDLLGKTAPRAAGGGTSGQPDWRLLADSGWLGLEIPEAAGGAGATFAEVAVILEEMGRAATPGPYLGSVVLGAGALTLAEPTAERDRLLGQLAAGETVIAVAVATGDRGAVADPVPFRLERSAGRVRLHGRATFVPDAADAGRLLLLARDPDGSPVLIDVTAGGAIDVAPQPVLDATRGLATISASGLEVTEASVWPFTDDPETSARLLFDRAAVAVACDSLGLAEAMLDATVSYAGVRQQFGRPIGSFQAVKHACADMLVQTRVTRELVAAAVERLASAGGDTATAASMAKSYAGDAAVQLAGKAMQLHGGIGYTWESGIHAYLKRASLNRSLFGSPMAHRTRIARRYR